MVTFQNMNKVKRLEIAEHLDFYRLSYIETKDTLRKLLEDPKYMTNIKKVSATVRDYRESPLHHAIWWIEWLLRNSDSNYLTSSVNDLGYIVANSLDVIAFTTVLIILCFIILFKLVFLVCKLIIKLTMLKDTKDNDSNDWNKKAM